MTDPYFDVDTCARRLMSEYMQHKSLIVAVDFDDTVYDFHRAGHDYGQILDLVRRCQALGFHIVLFTGTHPDRYPEQVQYLAERDIDIKFINRALDEGHAGDSERPEQEILMKSAFPGHDNTGWWNDSYAQLQEEWTCEWRIDFAWLKRFNCVHLMIDPSEDGIYGITRPRKKQTADVPKNKFEKMRIEQLRTKEVFFQIFFDNPDGGFEAAKRGDLCISNRACRHCGGDVKRTEAGVIVGYWEPIWYIAHKACEKPGTLDEALECQCIDADCNDCGHFRRGNFNKLPDVSNYAIFTGNEESDIKEQKRYMGDLMFVGSFDGECMKFGRHTSAWPKQATCRPCFEHRRLIAAGDTDAVTVE